VEIFQAIIIGVISGAFSAGTIWGILKTEMRFMRRDIDEVREFIWPERRAVARKTFDQAK